MSRSVDHDGVVVLMRGRHERLVLEMFSLLSECFPHRQGAAFESAFLTLRVHMKAEQAIGVLNGIMSVMATMLAAGRLPALNAHRQTAGKDEFFFITMLGAAQQSERARPIEAAIALLNTGHVFAVIAAARSLSSRLKDAGILLTPVGEGVFGHLAGYSVITGVPRPAENTAAHGVKPTLTLLKTA